MSSINVPELLETIQRVNKSKVTDIERAQLVLASQELLAKVERPWDTLKRIVWINPAQMGAARTLVDLKLFEKWQASGGDVKTPEELAALVGCEPYLLERLLRVMTSTGLLENPGPHQYALNDFSKSLSEDLQQAAIRYWYDVNVPTYTALPAYLASHQYKTPAAGPDATAFNWGRNTIGTLFDYFSSRPQSQVDFDRCMVGYAGSFTPWTEVYPTEKLLESSATDDVVVCDVGGGVGHDLQHFANKHKLALGRLVLQDQPKVVERAQTDSSITVMGHDFFTPQPVKARAYYLHSVLHDWPDVLASKILENLKPAMERGKSKILIHDFVLFPQGNSAMASHSDLLMMSAGNAKERSLEMWTGLVEPLGYKIVEVHTRTAEPQCVVEVELA